MRREAERGRAAGRLLGRRAPRSRWGGPSPVPPPRLHPLPPRHPAGSATLTWPSVTAWGPQGPRKGRGEGSLPSPSSHKGRGLRKRRWKNCGDPAPNPQLTLPGRAAASTTHETAPAPAQPPLPPAGAGPRGTAPASGRVGTAPRVAAYPELAVDTALCGLPSHLLPPLVQE